MFIVVFIITILILVLIHELGHYLVAKHFNIKVLEFGFGIPPRVWGKKIGETIVSLNWLPFGGFVRLLGEDEVSKEVLKDARSFASQRVLKRVLVVVAGVFMNMCLAWVLFWIVLGAQNFTTQIPLLAPHQFWAVNQVNEEYILVGDVAKSSPAEKAGLKNGDRVISFNGKELQSAQELIDKTKSYAGEEVSLTLSDSRKQKIRRVEVVPRKEPPSGQGPIGVSLGSIKIANLEYKNSWQKVFSGPIHSVNLSIYSWKILSQTVSKSFEKKDFTPLSHSVAGPVGITTIVKEILSVKNPLLPYLEFMAALSLNLAIVNILPFPGLDGGRLLFLLIEGSIKRKVHATVEKYIHAAGLIVLLALIFLITLSDIRKFF